MSTRSAPIHSPSSLLQDKNRAANDDNWILDRAVGAGAVGAFYGSRLHRPEEGVKVSMVCRSNYEQVKQHGIEIESGTFGTYRMRPSSVFSSIAEAAERGPSSGSDRLMSSSWDYVILCTKVLPDRVDDAELVAPLLQIPELGGPVPTLVLIQNGVGFEDGHRQRHPLVPILSAVSVVNAEQLAPGYVRHNHWTRISIGPYLAFDGYLEQHVTHPPISQQLQSHSQAQLELLVKLFMNGQIADAEMYGERDLQILRWHKLAINASMNPSSILCGGKASADMLKDGELRTHLTGCMEEVFAAACTIFAIPSFPDHFASIERILQSTEKAGARARIKPSMLADWERGSPLEIDAILGTPIRIANRAGIHLPRIQSMYAFLSKLQRARFQDPQASPLPT
ncbi:hypothetical protein PCANC_00066 [Puccinia coronata f. sp. avenae]|uniref:2-dehydropantoate 2-reductase n=1 Tax=Puccinia coronata f. sp. avenae TaxID=200324 RepID=A0A2N5S852_9BASI|nr:hypothetical protein PCASD_22930 [Puccinia coronata f. sp. avenae]PLW19433.1 hypothetical protein PCANC_06339 [Puccinia coronata f. sp. avenae]PLW46722.1 hypothetical protein PCASD_03659 [Puccinia coronata f. sp. avenae]PLW58569.1 hypothetical protein PCANC_00066 [Puccinia coronata f. sp. avenae]